MKVLCKYPVEGALAVKSGVFISFGDTLIGVAQQRSYIIQPCFVQILIEIAVEGRRKYAGQDVRTDPEIVSHASQCHRLFEMRGNVQDGLIDQVMTVGSGALFQMQRRETARDDDLHKSPLQRVQMFTVTAEG